MMACADARSCRTPRRRSREIGSGPPGWPCRLRGVGLAVGLVGEADDRMDDTFAGHSPDRRHPVVRRERHARMTGEPDDRRAKRFPRDCMRCGTEPGVPARRAGDNRWPEAARRRAVFDRDRQRVALAPVTVPEEGVVEDRPILQDRRQYARVADRGKVGVDDEPLIEAADLFAGPLEDLVFVVRAPSTGIGIDDTVVEVQARQVQPGDEGVLVVPRVADDRTGAPGLSVIGQIEAPDVLGQPEEVGHVETGQRRIQHVTQPQQVAAGARRI